jgi:hypothetical protein
MASQSFFLSLVLSFVVVVCCVSTGNGRLIRIAWINGMTACINTRGI